MSQNGQGLTDAALPEDRVAERLSKKKGPRKRLSLPFRIFLVLLTLFLIASSGGYILYRRWLADPERVRAFAREKIGRLFPGKKVTIGSADFSLLDGLDLFDVRVADEDTGFEVIRLTHARVTFDPASLLRFKLLIEAVSASDLFVDLVRLESGEWNLALPQSSPTSGAEVIKRPFSVILQGAFVSLDDAMIDYAVSFSVTRASLLSGPEGFGQWRLSAEFGGGLLGKWQATASYNPADGDGEVQFKVADLDLGTGLRSRVPPAAKRIYDLFEPSGPADASGRITRDANGSWRYSVEADLKGCGARYRKFPVQAADVQGTLIFNEKGASFEDVTCASMGGAVVLAGKTVGYGSNAGVEISFNTQGTHVTSDLMEALPEKVAAIIAQFHPEGPSDIDVALKRPPGPARPYEISLVAHPRGIKVTYDLFPLEVDDITGTLSYAGGDLEIAELGGTRGDMLVGASGTVKNLSRESDLEIRLQTMRVPLEEEIRTLLPAAPAQFWKSLDPSGEADAEIVFTKPSGEPLDVAVRVRLVDVDVIYEHFPYRLSKGEGEFSYEDGVILIESPLTFEHGGATVALSGSIDSAGGQSSLVVTAANVPLDEELRAAVGDEHRARLDSLRISGRCDASAVVSRTAEGETSVDQIKAQARSTQLRPQALPLALGDADASVTIEGGELEVTGLQAVCYNDNALVLLPFVRLALLARPTMRLAATGGGLEDATAFSWDACFEAENVFVEETLAGKLPAVVSSVLAERNIRGFVSLRGDVEHNDWGDEHETLYSLGGRCDGVSMDFGKSFENVTGRIRLEGDAYSDSAAFVASGSLESLEVDGDVAGETTFALESLDGETLLRAFDASALGGRISGQAHLPASEEEPYAFSVQLEGVALARVLEQALGFKREGLAGKASGKVEAACLTGRRDDLMGVCDATIKDGTLWEVPMVLALFNVLNLKMPERTQFTEAKVRCHFAHGRVIISELSMASDPATIVGKGAIGFDGTLDMEFYAQPGRIPVISLVAGQVGRNIAVARVTGTFATPKVSLVPSGAFGALFNIVKSPFDARK